MSTTSWKNTCRTCLSSGNLRTLEKMGSESTSPAEMLQYIRFKEFTENENTPERICNRCFHELKQAYMFLIKFTTTNRYLENQQQREDRLIQWLRSEQIQEITTIKMQIKPKDSSSDADSILEIDAEQNILKTIEFQEATNDPMAANADEIDNNPSVQTINEDNFSDIIFLENNNQNLDGINEPNDELSKQNLTNLFQNIENQLSAKFEIQKNPNFLCIVCGKFNTGTVVRTKVDLLCTCPDCGIIFLQMRNHKNVELMNTNHQPHVCVYCNKLFPYSSQLKEHIRLHTGERPYMCEYCGVSFTYMRNLTNHIRTHTGEKPYRCNDCCKFFARKSNLNAHKRRMHKIEHNSTSPE